MPLQTLKAQIRVESVANSQQGPQASFDTFTEDSTTQYDTAATHTGAGVATREYGDYRIVAVAGNEDFDLANTSTPIMNREREQIVFSRVMLFYLKNYSTTAILTYNKGPNPCGLPAGTLNPGEDTAFRSGVGGVGVAITPATASGFRVTSSANDAAYSIFFAGMPAVSLMSASIASTSSTTASLAYGAALSASISTASTALGNLAVDGALSASISSVSSFLAASFFVSTESTPP